MLFSNTSQSCRWCKSWSVSTLLQIGNDDNKERMEYVEQLHLILQREQLLTRVILLPISPWGHFTFPLNCAISRAVDDGFNIIAFQVHNMLFSQKWSRILMFVWKWVWAINRYIRWAWGFIEVDEGLHWKVHNRAADSWDSYFLFGIPNFSNRSFNCTLCG